MIDFELTCCALDNFFFDCPFGDEAVDDDLLFLADTVGAVYGLEVDLGVPVGVKDYDDVCTVKVDS